MTSVIVQHIETGERQVVADLEGYDEAQWGVLGIDREPAPFEVWDEVAEMWVLDQAAKDDAEDLAEVRDVRRLRARLSRGFRNLRDRIEQLEAEVALLKGN